MQSTVVRAGYGGQLIGFLSNDASYPSENKSTVVKVTVGLYHLINYSRLRKLVHKLLNLTLKHGGERGVPRPLPSNSSIEDDVVLLQLIEELLVVRSLLRPGGIAND